MPSDETRSANCTSGGFGGQVLGIMALKMSLGRCDRRDMSVSGSRAVFAIVGNVAALFEELRSANT